MVPLCAEALTTECEAIVQDIAPCFQDKKRSYVKSGNFAKRAKTNEDLGKQVAENKFSCKQPF